MRKANKKLSFVMAIVMLFSIFSTSYGNTLMARDVTKLVETTLSTTTGSALTTTDSAIDVVDTKELKALLEELKSIDESKYTKESIEKLNDAITKVELLLQQQDITAQEVAKHLTMLQIAKESLALKGNGKATFVIQRSTLGQPYYLEPTLVEFTEGENVAQVLVRLLGEGNYESSGRAESGFYLAQVKLHDNLDVNVPRCILDFSGLTSDDIDPNDDDWLGEFDHTFMSGWIYWVNHVHMPYGMSDAKLKDGDVVRLQFTVHGYGTDLGLGDSGWGQDMPAYSAADKDEIIKEVAKINQNKGILSNNPYLQSTYDEANKVIDQIDATQQMVNGALEELKKALHYVVPDTAELESIIQQATNINNKYYTQESIENLNVALEQAIAIKDKVNKTQQEVNTVITKLKDAMERLVEKPKGKATFVVERSTLGQSFYLKPTTVEFVEGESVAEVLVRTLGEENVHFSGSVDSGFYLRSVLLKADEAVSVPQYVLDYASLTANDIAPNNDKWLGEFDHHGMSGWMYFVNHEMPNFGMSDYNLADGDVVRLQFTLYGYGADLGFGWGDSICMPANKDELIKSLAWVNENSDVLQNNLYLKREYDTAVEVVSNIIVEQKVVEDTLVRLQKAMAYVPPNTSELEVVIKKAQKIDQTLYTENSVKDLQQALEKALQINDKIDKTQKEVDGVINELQAAIDGLVYSQIDIEYKDALNYTLDFMYENTPEPQIGTIAGEWTVLSLARGNYPYSKQYMNDYYKRVVKEVQDKKGVLHKRKYTEYSRVVLGLTAIGQDVTNIGGYNFLEKLADFDKVTWQGINGSIFALIALDSHAYEIPQVEDVKTLTTRDLLVADILKQELPGGGFNLMGNKVDVDITAMVLQSLAPYKEKPQVKDAIQRALTVLSSMQTPQGDFENAFGGSDGGSAATSESTSQVIVALCALGIDPHTDPRFVKEQSAVDGLIGYYVDGGGFKHLKEGSVDAMATDQAAYALVAYDRFVNEQNTLYNMMDVEIVRADKIALEQLLAKAKALDDRDYTNQSWDSFKIVYNNAVKIYEDIKVNQATVNQANEQLQKAIDGLILKEIKDIAVGEDKVVIDNNVDANYVVKIEEVIEKASIEIAEDIESKVTLDLTGQGMNPTIEVHHGADSIVIPADIQITGNKAIEVFSKVAARDKGQIKDKLLAITEAGIELTVDKVYGFGNKEGMTFNDYVILTFAGAKSQEVAYIDQIGEIHKITKVNTLEEGKKYEEFAYQSGNDLQVYTKHFTDFVTYNVKKQDTGGGGGGTLPEEKNYITLSIDKLTINKGYVLPPTRVPFTPGENVWDVLQREMDARGITYEYEYTPKYQSVYVQSIAGDGEFDHGRWSGWMYNVNGWYPNYGASKYILENGDKVEWRYTTNLGDDLGVDNSQWETYPDGTPKFPGIGGGTLAEVSYPVKDNTFMTIEGVNIARDKVKDYKDNDAISQWARNSVVIATGLGLVEGYEGYFKPQDAISRAEFTKMIVEVLGLELKNPTAVFEDVAEEAWYAPYIQTAFEAGIVKGYGKLFKPSQTITRQEMAVILNQVLQLEDKTEAYTFKDQEEIGGWAKVSVENVYNYGIITGKHERFYPTTKATREMVAVALVRAYKHLNHIGVKEMTDEVQIALNETTRYMLENVSEPVIGSIGGEWAVFGLARREAEVPQEYYNTYYERVKNHVATEESKTDRKWKTKVTETQRIAIALTAIGKDPTNVSGFNLIDYSWNKGKNMPDLSEHDQILGNRQGLNELVFGLITIDLQGSKQPIDAVISRDEIIKRILGTYQTLDGGFNLREHEAVADVDMTAMTLQALAPYYKVDGYEHVTEAVDKALRTLSYVQTQNGAFENAYGGADGGNAATSESTSQVIVALCALGVDPASDERFVKNGRSVIDDLMDYYVEGGGFKHLKDSEVDQMATEQAYYALVAYERFLNGKTALYNMSDVK